MKNKLEPQRVSNPEKHRDAGRMGGLQTWLRFGTEYMQQIARRGGRPTRQEAAERAWDTQRACEKRAGRRGHRGGEWQRGRHAAQLQCRREKATLRRN